MILKTVDKLLMRKALFLHLRKRGIQVRLINLLFLYFNFLNFSNFLSLKSLLQIWQNIKSCTVYAGVRVGGEPR